MYTKQVPFKDFKGRPRNQTVHFNLTEDQVIELLVEFKTAFSWMDSVSQGESRTLAPEETVVFYRAFKEIVLSAWGEPSEDGLYFKKSGRYEFEDSALYAATMMMFFKDTEELKKFMSDVMPEGMEELARAADANAVKLLEESKDEDLKAEVIRLRSQLNQQSPSSS